MTKKLCTYPSCKTIVNHNDDGSSPRCELHKTQQRSRTRKHYSHHFDDQGRNIYKTAKWKQLRGYKIAVNPLCENCLHYNKAVTAQVIDHIIEIEDGGAIWDINNLQSLCNTCHNRKTAFAERMRNAGLKYDGRPFDGRPA